MFVAIYRKTLGDLSEPKSVFAYLGVFLTVLFFLGVIFTGDLPDAIASLPLGEQEGELLMMFLPLAWVWAGGLGLLLAGSLLAPRTIATEAERGTLDLLLSKSVRRWEVLLAMFLANVTYLFAVGVASLLLAALALYQMGGFSAAALGGGVFDLLPAIAIYMLFICVLLNAIGTAASVFTRNRLQTAALTALIPVLFFVLLVARLFPGTLYEDYSLYLVDIGYRLGNIYILVLERVWGSIPVDAQASLGLWTGVYKLPEGEPLEGSLELMGYIDPAVSLCLCLVLTVGSLGVALVKFQQLDI
jgi:ABC-2 type transport system permease protein